jgi:competence ComEA-like helix-hairpin-helix protein
MKRDSAGRRAPKPTRTVTWIVLTTSLWALTFVLTGLNATAHPAMSVSFAAPAQDAAEDAFGRVCSNCHDPDRIRRTRRTRSGWLDVIDQMIDQGAGGTERDFELALQYLVTNYGMVNVNQAEASEIALVTRLPSKQAESVVAYRKKNGSFKSFEELANVPDLDVQTLEAHKAAIIF